MRALDPDRSPSPPSPLAKVAMVGSGAWACAAARMVAQNTVATPGGVFQDTVPMWVYEETVEVRCGVRCG